MIVLRKRLPALFSLLLLLSGCGYALYVHEGYAKGRREYGRLAEQYTSPCKNSDELTPEVPEEKEQEKESEEMISTGEITAPLPKQADPILSSMPADAPSRLQIRWDDLLRLNEDVIGWISVPAAGISYPVLQGEDNDYYLHRDIHRQYLYAGSIFMDAGNSASLTDYNTIIYGHNMRDGTMFASLKNLLNGDTIRTCPYLWIQTPDKDCLYEVFSIHQAQSASDTFTIRFDGAAQLGKWLASMKAASFLHFDVPLGTQEHVVTLSTCTQDSAIRMVVMSKLIYIKEKR